MNTFYISGLAVDFNWLLICARSIHRATTGGNYSEVGRHVIVAYLDRYRVKMRKQQRNKQPPKESFREDVTKALVTAREKLIRTGLDDRYHEKCPKF